MLTFSLVTFAMCLTGEFPESDYSPKPSYELFFFIQYTELVFMECVIHILQRVMSSLYLVYFCSSKGFKYGLLCKGV